MTKKKYAVMLLNYNTVEDAIIAASSIVKNAVSDDYVICFIDGCSTKDKQVDIFRNADIHNTCVLALDENMGYAKGNNAGIRFLLKKYDIEHFVIMNPDVEVQNYGMIDALIEKLNTLDKSYCGIQPLIWTPCIGNEANLQTCIRKVYSYFDCIIDSFYPIRKIFSSKYKELIYYKERPYKQMIEFEVPTGCFFIIKADIFVEIGMFDERTFLYAEEIILGHQLKAKNYKFILDPNWIVIHEWGKSTGGHNSRISSFVAKEEIRALEVYLKFYLNCGKMKIALVKYLFMFNFHIKKYFFACKLALKI